MRALYQRCDVALKENPDKRITVLANENGRAAIQELIPETPIDWLKLSEFQLGWRAVDLVPSGPWDARRIGIAITRLGASVLITDGEDYEILEQTLGA